MTLKIIPAQTIYVCDHCKIEINDPNFIHKIDINSRSIDGAQYGDKAQHDEFHLCYSCTVLLRHFLSNSAEIVINEDNN